MTTTALQDAILAWYGAVARDLPWRRTRDPYVGLAARRRGAARAAGRGAPPGAPARAPAGTRVRFEDTDRWVRGRIVAALAVGADLPKSTRCGWSGR